MLLPENMFSSASFIERMRTINYLQFVEIFLPQETSRAGQVEVTDDDQLGHLE